MPLLGVVYFAWLLYGRPAARRAIHIGLLVVICAGIPGQDRTARSIGVGRRDLYVRIEGGLQRGLRPARLLDLSCPALFPDRAKVYESFRMLKQAGVGKFRYLPDGSPEHAARPDPDTKRR
jgi:hypothetical protein